MSINLSRNTRLWVSTVTTGHTNENTFEIPVQDGYGLSQTTSTSDVAAEEAGATPIRGSKRFNDMQDPVDWNFTTYMTPYFATNHYMVDMLLWHALANAKDTAPDLDNTSTTSTVFGDPTDFTVEFTNNSAHELTPIYLYYKIDNQMYLVSEAQVSQAEINVDITDIGQVAWTGQALSYAPIADPAFVDADGSNGLAYDTTTPTANTYVGIATNKQYLVNKLTIMELNSDQAPSGAGTNGNYKIPITGASVTINNNITYLTPSTLAEVDSPIGSFTGSFDVSGSVQAYLRDVPGSDGAIGNEYGSQEFLQHMIGNVQNAVVNAANVVFHIGGNAVGDPNCVITVPAAQISVPEIAVEDIIATSFEFKGIPSSADLVSGDEVSLAFRAQ